MPVPLERAGEVARVVALVDGLFRDGELLEGVMPNNLLQNEPNGFSFVPPDPTFQNQRIFVPREAVSSLEVLGVIGSPLRRRPKPTADDQLEMFQ